MNPVAQAQQDTVEEFQLFDDWMVRYEHIIDMGKALPDFPVEWRTEENRIRGCQSQVWFQIEMLDSGKMDAAERMLPTPILRGGRVTESKCRK